MENIPVRVVGVLKEKGAGTIPSRPPSDIDPPTGGIGAPMKLR